METSIKVIKSKNGYAFTAPTTRGGKYVYIWVDKDGIDETILSPGVLYTCEVKPKIKVMENISIKSYAQSLVGGKTNISVDKYEEIYSSLIIKKTKKYLDNDEEYTIEWNSLEDEFNFRKFAESYKIVTRNELVYVQDVQIDVEFEVPVEEPFIIPVRYLGLPYTNQLVVYSRKDFYVHHARKVFISNGMNEVERDTTKTTFKIYSFRDNEVSCYWDGKSVLSINGLHKVTDSYDEVKTLMKNDRNFITETIELYINGSSIPMNKTEMVVILKNIKDKLANIEYKKISRDNYMGLRHDINSLISDVELSIKKEVTLET